MMLGGKRKRQVLSLAAKLDSANLKSFRYISKLRTNPTYGHPSVPRCPAKRGKGVMASGAYIGF